MEKFGDSSCPGHGSPQGDREVREGFWGPADRGILVPILEYWQKNATIGWSPHSSTYFPISLRRSMAGIFAVPGMAE